MLRESWAIASVDIVSEGAFALLYMGTKHNRWYVEKLALNYFSGDIEGRLLQRMIMEIKVDRQKFCNAINHLFYSITVHGA